RFRSRWDGWRPCRSARRTGPRTISRFQASGWVRVLSRKRSQLVDPRVDVVGPEHCGSGDEGVRAGLGGYGDRVDGDAAVDLQPRGRAPPGCLAFQRTELGHHVVAEALSAESGLHRHHEDLIEL